MAKKKKGLPFVVQPRLAPIIERIGSETSGVLEIERKGYLTVAEKSIVQKSMGDNTHITSAFMMAKDIAAKEGLTAEEVFKDIASNDHPAYLNSYKDDISKCMASMMAHEEKLRLIAASTLILTRIDSSWEPDETTGIHPDLIDALYKLYTDEDQKSVEALEAAATANDKMQEGAQGKE